ncbi:MAG: ATP-grasp domain-containing protein [Rubrobacteraceae bacterium]
MDGGPRDGRRSVAVKVVDGRVGRGAGVLLAPDGTLPARAPFDGPYLVQEYVPGDGWDRKLYVAGSRAHGLLKRSPPHVDSGGRGEQFSLDVELADLSRLVGEALGLEVYGVDFIEGPAGPSIIDVNPFPGFKGVRDAADSIARHLLNVATETRQVAAQ